jgi:hypothetical protein
MLAADVDESHRGLHTVGMGKVILSRYICSGTSAGQGRDER